MKKLLLLCLLVGSWLSAAAQVADPNDPDYTPPPTRWKQRADSIFQHLDRSLVGTGLLLNYGFALKDPAPFQGAALSPANLLRGPVEWRLLYTALESSRFNASATLPALTQALSRLDQADAQQASGGGPVSVATLLARYDRFRDDAGPSGLVTVSNRQLYDNPNRPRSPYEQRTLVALSPLQTLLDTRTPSFVFPTRLRFTNAVSAIALLELDASDGQGYRTVTWGQPLAVSYPADGAYTLRFRLTCADGTVLLAQSGVQVQQPETPATRYGDGGLDSYHSSQLFTDTRPYNGVAATGRVTVAYAAGNTDRKIHRPLIVIEGYDPSRALNRLQDNYSYNSFVIGKAFGGINIDYPFIDPATGNPVSINFNSQLSAQYDLIFLDYDNGTDYIQRNAYLVERLIQWVNDNKVPLAGPAAQGQNIVMGMSMGGLVACYALRDMELRGLAHDTRLYISHEAPQQGANVPLGVQYLVKGLAGYNLLPGLALGGIIPQLNNAARLLSEPATRQLLIYQADPDGASMHAAWLSEYKDPQRGYPRLCRNVATSGGSECGRGQDFGPYDLLLDIKGTGLLHAPYNTYTNGALFAAGFFGTYAPLKLAVVLGLALPVPLGLPLALTSAVVGALLALGDNEGFVDFVVNALPDRQQKRVFYGRFRICKDVLGGALTTCVLNYADDKNSAADMLPYDSTPGGIYNIDQVGFDLGQVVGAVPVDLYRVNVRKAFCFVPTTSALDIGQSQVTLSTANLTADYNNLTPPAAPLNSPFANFITAGRANLTHILWTGLNSRWVLREMAGSTPQNEDCIGYCQASLAVSGPNSVCTGTSVTYSVAGLPANASVTWQLSTGASVAISSTTAPTFTIFLGANSASGPGTLKATITSPCGDQVVANELNLYFGAPEAPGVELDFRDDCNHIAYFHLNNYAPALTYTHGLSMSNIAPDGTFWVKSQSYYVTATSVSCGAATTTGSIPFESCQGPVANAYTVYPNPADDQVTVEQETIANRQAAELPASKAGAAGGAGQRGAAFTVAVYDGYGQLWQTSSASGTAAQLNTSVLPAGLYLLVITEAGSGAVVRRQLQVTRQ